jgi:hypothetical protein
MTVEYASLTPVETIIAVDCALLVSIDPYTSDADVWFANQAVASGIVFA